MIGIGISINLKIYQHFQLTDSEYNTSVRVHNQDDFNYVLDTQEGRIVVEAPIQSVDPVSFPEMKGKYMAVDKTKQVYTEHTRTTTDSKGKTHTETYWTWDDEGTESIQSKQIKVYNKVFNTDKFNLPSTQSDDIEKIIQSKYLSHSWFGGIEGYYYTSSSVRYYYNVLSVSFKGSFWAVSDAKGLHGDNGNINLIQGNLKDLDNLYLHTHGVWYFAFWFGWIVLTGLIIFGFVVIDNRWLEDKKR